MIIIDDDIKISVIDNLFKETLEKMTTKMTCPICHSTIEIPLMVKKSDIEIINKFKNILFQFMKDHPEVGERLRKELADDLLDLYNKYHRYHVDLHKEYYKKHKKGE